MFPRIGKKHSSRPGQSNAGENFPDAQESLPDDARDEVESVRRDLLLACLEAVQHPPSPSKKQSPPTPAAMTTSNTSVRTASPTDCPLPVEAEINPDIDPETTLITPFTHLTATELINIQLLDTIMAQIVCHDLEIHHKHHS